MICLCRQRPQSRRVLHRHLGQFFWRIANTLIALMPMALVSHVLVSATGLPSIDIQKNCRESSDALYGGTTANVNSCVRTRRPPPPSSARTGRLFRPLTRPAARTSPICRPMSSGSHASSSRPRCERSTRTIRGRFRGLKIAGLVDQWASGSRPCRWAGRCFWLGAAGPRAPFS